MNKREVVEELSRGEGCLGKAADDEPIFVLRGQDRTMPFVLRRWADMVEAASRPDSGSREKARRARAVAREVEEWQKTNPSKNPD